jgi:hypothetical protein
LWSKNDAKNIQQNENSSSENIEQETNSALDEKNISFHIQDVRNDVTGNWRVATIAENIDISEYALDYYNEYFESDDEIHAIINFNYNTTTQIRVLGNQLDVTVYEYVDKEEHDAKLLFSGMKLKEYSVDIESGEIEEVK